MSPRVASQRLSGAVWLALWGSLSCLTHCRDGSDVYLGRATSSNSGTGGGASGPCGALPCATHVGMRLFVDPSADADSEDRFGQAVGMSQPDREPRLVYPSNETMLPINVRNIRHVWEAAGNTLFELEFKGPSTTVLVYTQTTTFVPNDEQWDWIAESNRGGIVSLTVRGLDLAAPNTAFSSSSISLHFSAQAIEGAIYHWSTADKGVMKALISDPTSIKFYPEAASAETEKCAGCYALSRDGKHLAVALGPELRVVSVPEREVVLPVNSGVGGAGGVDPMKGDKTAPAIPAGWSSFSPDGSRLLLATDGKMSLLDATTGATLGPPDAIAMPTKFATHPDWPAHGGRVALTLADKGSDKEVEAGSIALAQYHEDSDTFDPPEVIVASTGPMDNNFFPVWSPDSRFLAYVNTSGKSQDSPPATLKLYDIEAERVIELFRLNQRVNNQDGAMKMGNSMPTWAPSTTGAPFWLAFSSIRPYASVPLPDNKSDQLWIAAIDPRQLEQGLDPSYAAFWAPFQSLEQDNQRAFWTHTAEDRLCHPVDVCGDQLDNDCDGTADEADCAACAAGEAPPSCAEP